MLQSFLYFLVAIKTMLAFSLTQEIDSINIETNTYQIVVTSFGTNIATPSHAVTFAQSFVSSPKIITNIRGIFNCFPQSISSSSLNGFLIESRISLLRGYDPLINIKVYYFVSEDKNTDIIANIYTAANITTPNHTYTINLSLSDYKESIFQNSSVFMNCFISGIYCRQATTTFIFKNRCYKIGNRTVAYETQTTAFSPFDCNRYDIHFTYLVIFPKQRLTLLFGTMTVTPSSTAPLSISSSQPDTVFVIGLASIETHDCCLQFQLKQSNTEIDISYNNFIKLDFNYVQIKYTVANPKIVIRTLQYFPFTDKVTYYFQNMGTYHYLYTSKSNVFNSSFKLIDRDSQYARCSIISPISDQPIQYLFYLIGNKYNYKVTVTRLVIFSKLMKIDINNRIYDVYLMNTNQSITDKNITLGSEFKLKQIIRINSSLLITRIQHNNKTEIGDAFSVMHRSSHNYNKSGVYLNLITVTKYQTNILSSSSILVIEGIPRSTDITINQFIWQSFIINKQIINKYQKYLQFKLQYQYGDNYDSILEFQYMTDTNNQFQVHFTFRYISIISVEYLDYSKQCRIYLKNINKYAILSEFGIEPSDNIIIQSIQVKQQYTILTFDYSEHNQSQEIDIYYKPSNSYYTQSIKGIKVPSLLFKSNDIPQLLITLKDQYQLLKNISLVNGPFEIINISQYSNNCIQITLPSSDDLHGTIINLRVDYNTTTPYYQNIHIKMDTMLCIPGFQNQQQQFYTFLVIVVILYWMVYLIGIIFCQKIYVVQTMFILQFVYLSYLPIGNYCSPFSSFNVLKYSFGWNNLPFNVTQTPISSFYSSLGFQSNFICNLNFMILILLIFPLLSPVFLILGKNSQGYRAKPRLLALGKSFLLDIPFTIILFNIPNIVSSFIINFQTFGTNNTASFVASCISTSLILICLIGFSIFGKNFAEFRNQLCQTKKICGISMQNSIKIRRLYPVILILEFVSVSIVLSVKSFFNLSLYLSLAIITFVYILKLIILPYSSTLDNARLLVNQFFLILMNSLQIVFKSLKMQPKSQYNSVYHFPWSILVILIIIIVGNSFPYIIYKISAWFKSRGLIDISLYNQIHSIPIKPCNFAKERLGNISYPALQFSMYKQNRNRLGQSRQQLLKVSKINKQNKIQAKPQINWEYSIL